MLFTGIILLVRYSLKESEHSRLVLKLKENENTVLTVLLTSRSTLIKRELSFSGILKEVDEFRELELRVRTPQQTLVIEEKELSQNIAVEK